ncbi:MAG: hypothetical protein JWQ48_2381 [Conexibacter sp.]|nr:hypothetical protein [Conexibacter sp.]
MGSRRNQLTDEQRAERRRQECETAQRAVEALKSTEGWQRWLVARASFHRYSLSNQLLIAMQRPHATRVAGFRAWLSLGYFVRKGETSIRIWVPMKPTKKALAEWAANGSDPAAKPRTWFKLGPVFDRSQVEALPAPATPAPLDLPIEPVVGETLAWALEPLIALGDEIGSAVTFEAIPGSADGFYEIRSRRIAVEETLTPNGRVGTLVHELAHALVRADRRDDDPSLSYAEEELVVESVAYTVCGSAGLDTAGNSIPYLAAWSESASLATIAATAALIDRLARRIEDAVDAALRGETLDADEPHVDAAAHALPVVA